MNKWIVAVTVMLPTIVQIIDTSIVNVSLGHIRGSLSAGIDESTWVITSYLAANAIVIPMTGWLSRLFGRKRYLIGSVFFFTLTSFLCGISWSLPALIMFRVLQGAAGGALQPLSQAILLETFPPREHGMAMAIFGMGVMFGPIIGPLLGGWITDNWSWHWIFFINIPIGIVSILMTLSFIIDPHYVERRKMKIDYLGLSLLTVGIGCLQIMLDRGQREDWFASGFIFWLCIISFAALAVFIINELFAENPVVQFRIFRNPAFTAGNIIGFFTFFCLFGSIVLLPIYLQTLMGYTAFLAGLVLGPGGLMTMIAMPIAGKLITRVNPKGLLGSGIAVTAFSIFMMSQFSMSADFDAIVWPRIIMGLGMGFLFIPLMTLTMSWVRKEDMGNAASIFNFNRMLGGSFGVAFASTILSRRVQVHHSHLASNMSLLDRNFQIALPQVAQTLQDQGFAPALLDSGSLGTIYKGLVRQASMMAFNDTFYVLAVMMTCSIVLILLMRNQEHRADEGVRKEIVLE
jgi:DHA2 family multidrug resistance protein